MQSTPPTKDLQYSQSCILPKEITCRKCGNPYPETAEYWYYQDGIPKRPCKKCIKAGEARRRQGRGQKAIKPRPCQFCGEMFTPKNPHATNLKHCPKPECVKLARRASRERARKATRAWKSINGHTKPTLKVCPMCGKKRMEAQDHFSCRVCRVQAYKSGRCDGDYIYLPSIYEGEAIP